VSHNRSSGATFAWSEFASEEETTDSPVATERSRKALALVAGSDDLGGLSAFPSEIADDAASESQADPIGSPATTAANDPVTPHKPVSRWTRLFAAAFLFGAISTLIALAVVDRGSSDPVVFTHFEAVAVSDGISNALLAGLDRIEMRPPVPVAAVRRVVPQRVMAVEPAETSFDIKPDEIVTVFSEPASPTTLTGSEARNPAKDEQAVRQKLHSYEEFQGATFRPCSVVLAGDYATAECRGTMTQAPSPESLTPVSSEHQWTFKMRRDAGAWKIDEVSRSLPIDAARAPGQD
jgi:hypothetical protein